MKQIVDRVWVDDKRVYVLTHTGMQANYPFERWEKLKNATQAQREDFYFYIVANFWL